MTRAGTNCVAALLLVVCVSCGGGSGNTSGTPLAPGNSPLPSPGPEIAPIPIIAGQPVRVLYIGNSLTQANDLPLMVSALADGVGVLVQGTDVSQGGFSLEDHWNDGRAPRAIDQGGWHFVLMQQGPSALVSSRENLQFWARQFNARIRAVGGRPAMYMVWPEATRLDQFENVRLSYLAAAQEIHGIFLPAGDAWRAAWRQQADLQLYGSDGFHPSVLGTYTAALVIASKITSRSAIGMPTDFLLPNGTHVSIPHKEAAIAQAAAAEVIASE